ncbi:MAG: hypothetical protein FJ144_27615 [Deltaproteobacteria bacterium]|nr:hypothetical protein [Deltaproteobacteria bacterium]
MSTQRSLPRFNHVALTVTADELDASARADLVDFYGSVFGWTEMPTMSKDRELLVLRAWSNEQFVYIHASDAPMRCGTSEHLGLSVSTPAELDEMYARAKAFRDRDERVEVVDRQIEDFTAVKLHNFYVRYRLPFMIEVQCFEWAEGFSAESLP